MSNSRFVNGEPETIEVRLKTYFSLLDLLKYLRDLHSEGFDGIDSRATSVCCEHVRRTIGTVGTSLG